MSASKPGIVPPLNLSSASSHGLLPLSSSTCLLLHVSSWRPRWLHPLHLKLWACLLLASSRVRHALRTRCVCVVMALLLQCGCGWLHSSVDVDFRRSALAIKPAAGTCSWSRDACCQQKVMPIKRWSHLWAPQLKMFLSRRRVTQSPVGAGTSLNLLRPFRPSDSRQTLSCIHR